MECTPEIFLKYKKMVYSYTHRISDTYNIDFDDLIGDSMELFVNAISSFDSTKGAIFSTHLHYQLLQLNNIACKENNIREINDYGNTTHSNSHRHTATNSFLRTPDSCDLDPPRMTGHILTVVTHPLFIEALGQMDFSIDRIDLLDSIATELSSSAQTYLKDLFAGTFDKLMTAKGGRPTKFPVDRICKEYKWSSYKAIKVKEEITAWWVTYCMAS